jgi:hypothetical protein
LLRRDWGFCKWPRSKAGVEWVMLIEARRHGRVLPSSLRGSSRETTCCHSLPVSSGEVINRRS